MPRTTDSFAPLKASYTVADSYHISDQFMAGNARPRIRKEALLEEAVAVADTAGNDFDEDLALAWLLQVDVLEGESSPLSVDNDRFVRFG